MMNIRTPLLKGTDDGRKSLSLQSLQKSGVVLLGTIIDVVHHTAAFTNDVRDKINFADNFYKHVKKMIDDYIASHHLQIPEAIIDEADDSLPLASSSDLATTSMNMNGISTIIWATGFTHNLN